VNPEDLQKLVTLVDTMNPDHGIKKVVQPNAENILV